MTVETDEMIIDVVKPVSEELSSVDNVTDNDNSVIESDSDINKGAMCSVEAET